MAQYVAKDKTFLISGGASGLGAEYAQTFLSKGAKRVVILDIAEAVGKATAERLNKLYDDKVVFIKCDVSKEENITTAFDSALAQFNQIDVIINNAGIMSDAPEMWRTACDLNWQGTVSLTLKGIKHMRKDEGGSGGTIVNVSSVAAIQKFPYVPTYNGSKIAVLHFSQCLAMNSFYERTHISVLSICPGSTDTPIMQNLVAKSYDPSIGRKFAARMTEIAAIQQLQRVDSAVAAFVHMFENGAPGTIWLTVNNKPAKDITATINRIFKELKDEIYGD